MKKIISSIVIFVLGLTIPQLAQAQGTVYFTNLGLSTTGSAAVSSNSWFAAGFYTGTNVGGYFLNSIQVSLTNATGNPPSLAAMIYNDIGVAGAQPGTNQAALLGIDNPLAGGIYSYTNGSNFILAQNTSYFIVLMTGAATTNGAYQWNVTGTPTSGYNNYHWAGGTIFLNSTDGLNWTHPSGIYGQFGINATAIPEPGIISLCALGGLGFLWQRRKTKAL